MKKEDLRIVFMGTPEFAVETLKALVENQYKVVAVVTQPDKPVGRHQDTVQPSEVLKVALIITLSVIFGAILILAAQYWGKKDTKSIKKIIVILLF